MVYNNLDIFALLGIALDLMWFVDKRIMVLIPKVRCTLENSVCPPDSVKIFVKQYFKCC